MLADGQNTVGTARLTCGRPQISSCSPRSGLNVKTSLLLDPARSPGGARRYSTDDIDRLQAITTLMSSGLNLAGVRLVLELQEETRRLQAEIERLRNSAGDHATLEGNRDTPVRPD